MSDAIRHGTARSAHARAGPHFSEVYLELWGVRVSLALYASQGSQLHLGRAISWPSLRHQKSPPVPYISLLRNENQAAAGG
jgi:hypothetical protein